jgi:hypothetical protein
MVAVVQLLFLVVVSASWQQEFLVPARGLKSPTRVSSSRSLQRLKAASNDHDEMDEFKYLRWYQPSASNLALLQHSMLPMELQTRVTTFQGPMNNDESSAPSTIQLHAQFHFADRPEYYNLSSSSAINTVFYELLLDESLLQKQDKYNKKIRIRENVPLQSSVADRQVAHQYGWICQVDATHYQQPNWYHADWTRQELLRRLRSTSSSPSLDASEEDRLPLWQRAVRTDRWSAAYEATTALWTGPPMVLPSQMTKRRKAVTIRRRIFTHLFLPGDALALGLRSLLWFTVPCPELSILLLDGSLLYWSGDAPTVTAQSRLSPILLPMLQAALSGRWQHVRQLVFGQVAVAGHVSTASKEEDDKQSLLITQRNDHALQHVFAELKTRPQQTIALLYGCHHCPDLHRKLELAGFHETQSQWRTAWSVPSHSAPVTKFHGTTTGSIFGYVLLLVLPLYFLIGGLDWIETILDVVRALEEGDGMADASATSAVLLYLLRHVFLYVGLSKLALDGKTILI